MSKLVIIRGNSGSGKSTVSKELQKLFGRNTMLVSQDVIRREMLWVKDKAGTEAVPLLIELIKYGEKKSEIVILEGILSTKIYMPLFNTTKKVFGDNIYAYYFDIPFDETLKRHNTKEKRLEFGESEMRKWWIEKDFIGIIPEKVLTKEMEKKEIVEGIYSDVMSMKHS